VETGVVQGCDYQIWIRSRRVTGDDLTLFVEQVERGGDVFLSMRVGDNERQRLRTEGGDGVLCRRRPASPKRVAADESVWIHTPG
jgi:hypothetical protein